MKQREDKRVHDASLQMKMVTLIFAFYSSFNTEPIIPSVQLCKYFLIRLVKPPKNVNISEWRTSSILLYLREKIKMEQADNKDVQHRKKHWEKQL